MNKNDQLHPALICMKKKKKKNIKKDPLSSQRTRSEHMASVVSIFSFTLVFKKPL